MSQLSCNPQRLALLVRSIRQIQDEVTLHIRITEIGNLAIPEVHSRLRQTMTMLELLENRIKRILNSSFFDISESSELKFNSDALFIRRWVIQHPEWWSDATHGEPTNLENFLSRISEHPLECGRLIDASNFVAPLIYSVHDPSIIRRLWLSATDPRTTSVVTAGQRLRKLVEEVFGDQQWRHGIAPSWVDIHEQSRIYREIQTILGEVIAPWQLQFTGLTTDWKWSADERMSYLKKVADSEVAAASLSQGLGSALFRNISELPDDPHLRRARIDSIAFAVSTSTEVLRNAKVQQAQMDTDHLATMLAIPTILPLKLPWPSSLMIGQVTTGLVQRIDTTEGVNVSSAIEQIRHHEALAAIGLMGVWQAAITSGRIESPVDEPPPDLQLEMQHTLDVLDNPGMRGQAFAEISR